MKITNNLVKAQIPLADKHTANSLTDSRVPFLLDDRVVEASPENDAELKEAFQNFVGQTVFGQMLKSMRSTVHEAPYFHGGQTEVIFQEQLDNKLSEEMTKSSASSFSDPMFKLFQLNRK